jgi:iron complex outermembrane receptor protein
MQIANAKVCALSLAVAAASQGWAQEQVPAGPAFTSIEEVVVTARRREESSQAVPVSVQALGADQLIEKNVKDMSDLTNLTPGLRTVTTGGGVNADVSMRGLKRVPIGDGASAVVIYVADVPLPYNASLIPTFDLERIQVLKGPQGTLFGRNTLGGAVLLTPQQPSFDGVHGYAKAGFGNYDSALYEGAVNVPLSDTLAMRVAVQKQHRDGYVENIGVGHDLNDVNNESARISLLWEPTPALSNLLIADYMEGHETGTASVPDEVTNAPGGGLVGILGDPAQVVATQKALGRYKIAYSQEPIVDRKFWGVSNKTEWDLDAFTIRNIFGYRESQSFVLQDTDGTALPVFAANSLDDSSQLTNELQFLGSAFAGRLDWVVGAFYLKSEAEGPSGSQFAFAPPVFGQTPWSVAFYDRENKAVFGQFGYDLSDWVEGLSLNLGYRTTWSESSACAYSESTVNYRAQTGPGNCPVAEPELENTEDTWTVGLDYQLNDDVFLYVTSRRGYREGGLNTPGFTGTPFEPFQTYDPEYITDIEAGIKTDWMVGDVVGRYNLSVYQTDYDDVQGLVNVAGFLAANPVAPLPGYSSLNLNGGATTIEGVESELVLQPTDNLKLTWLVNYLNQTVDKQVPAPFPGTSAPEITSPTPEWSTTVSARYAMPVDALETDLVMNADVYWSDEYLVGQWVADSYTLTNVRFQMDRILGSGFGVGLWAKNLFDEEYWMAGASTTPSIGIFTGQVGAPRMYGLEVNYKFGQ